MQLTINDDLVLAANLSDEDILLTLAISLFREERITLAQATRLSGLDRLEFQHHLSARKIPIHYGIQEWNEDLKTIESL